MAYRGMGRQNMGIQGGGQFPLQQQGMAQQPMMQQQPNYAANAMRLGNRLANSTDPAQQANIQQRLNYLNQSGRIGDNRLQTAMGGGSPMPNYTQANPMQQTEASSGSQGQPPAWMQPAPQNGPRGLLGPPPNQGMNAMRLGYQAGQNPAVQQQNMQRLQYLHDQGRIGDRRFNRTMGMAMPGGFQRQS